MKGRGTRGVIAIDANERNGEVVAMRLVTAKDQAMLITQNGIMIRTRVDEIRETGRNAAGVKLIRLDEGDKLVAMAKVEPDENEEKAGEVAPGNDGNPGAAPAGDGQAPPENPV